MDAANMTPPRPEATPEMPPAIKADVIFGVITSEKISMTFKTIAVRNEISCPGLLISESATLHKSVAITHQSTFQAQTSMSDLKSIFVAPAVCGRTKNAIKSGENI